MSDRKGVTLACPECGGTKFSWTAKIVQFGPVRRHGPGVYTEEAMDNGEVVGSDIAQEGVFCTGCEESFDRDELVPAE